MESLFGFRMWTSQYVVFWQKFSLGASGEVKSMIGRGEAISTVTLHPLNKIYSQMFYYHSIGPHAEEQDFDMGSLGTYLITKSAFSPIFSYFL